jgi:hypothetical protein
MNAEIVILIREFRFLILEHLKSLKAIDDLNSQLNTELIRQDLDNATKLIGRKMLKLKQRLQEAKDDLA